MWIDNIREQWCEELMEREEEWEEERLKMQGVFDSASCSMQRARWVSGEGVNGRARE